MSFPISLHKHIEYSCLNPKIRIKRNSYSLSYLIRSFKTDTANILSQTIWIFFNHIIHSGFIFLKYLYSQITCNIIFLEKHHGISHVSFIFKLTVYFNSHSFAYSLYLSKPVRLFNYYPKGIFSKLLNYSGGQGFSDSLYGT